MKGTVEDRDGNELEMRILEWYAINGAPTRDELISLAQRELQAAEKDAGAKAVRDFLAKVRAGDNWWLNLDAEFSTAFREMFGQDL